MLALTDPREAYLRSSLDARVHGGDSATLVQICLEQVILGLNSAIFAQQRGDLSLRSKSLTRALTAITALEMGVDRTAPLADALLQVYGSARRTLLANVTEFDVDQLAGVRSDFVEIEAALRSAA